MKKLFSLLLACMLLIACTACSTDNNFVGPTVDSTLDISAIAQCFNAEFVNTKASDKNTLCHNFKVNDMTFQVIEHINEEQVELSTDFYQKWFEANQAQFMQLCQSAQFTYKFTNDAPQNINETEYLHVRFHNSQDVTHQIEITAFTSNPEEAVNIMMYMLHVVQDNMPHDLPESLQYKWIVQIPTNNPETAYQTIYSGTLYR